ncbi:epocide hydrolase [Denitratisoma sp. DHT3]|uniref:epoxide hydrolase family protein n=1 Tax=Denitratisoma sp. DHT3 TaxID=1981880 RepID=UPI0011989361|nr:epoxide hydrolase family protein [Denitratisoma sp. DHT3]QDX81235.1 epocide hydrolase [Denitratisoma sp. DHT3]
MDIRPFRIDVPQPRLDYLRGRLADARWPDEPQAPPWALGTLPVVLRDLVAYWLRDYDWRRAEADLNRWPQFVAEVDGQAIHFLHVCGSGANPKPVLLIHGWPGGFNEFLPVIERLTRPERFGGDAEDGVTLVIPSLPGYGFSGKPSAPVSPRTIARWFDRLMIEGLGYADYLAQGGDWGSMVAFWLGSEGKGCAAVHTNFIAGWGALGGASLSSLLQKSMAQFQRFAASHGGYQSIQSTRPLTLAYGLQDSPLGTAAWILEKFHAWSDLKDGDLWLVYTREQLVTHLMIYLVTDTIGTSTWIYTTPSQDGEPAGPLIKPVAVAHFPRELVMLSRPDYEACFPIRRWTDHPVGGHFAAMEQPVLFAEDVLAFVRQLRGAQ